MANRTPDKYRYDQEPQKEAVVDPLQRRIAELNQKISTLITKHHPDHRTYALKITSSAKDAFSELLYEWSEQEKNKEKDLQKPCFYLDLPYIVSKVDDQKLDEIGNLLFLKRELSAQVHSLLDSAETQREENPLLIVKKKSDLTPINMYLREALTRIRAVKSISQLFTVFNDQPQVTIFLTVDDSPLQDQLKGILDDRMRSRTINARTIVLQRTYPDDRDAISNDARISGAVEYYEVPLLDEKDIKVLLKTHNLSLAETVERRLIQEILYLGCNNLHLIKQVVTWLSAVLREGWSIEECLIAMKTSYYHGQLTRRIEEFAAKYPSLQNPPNLTFLRNVAPLLNFRAASLQELLKIWPTGINDESVRYLKKMDFKQVVEFIRMFADDDLIRWSNYVSGYEMDVELKMLLDAEYRYSKPDTSLEVSTLHEAFADYYTNQAAFGNNIQSFMYHAMAADLEVQVPVEQSTLKKFLLPYVTDITLHGGRNDIESVLNFLSSYTENERAGLVWQERYKVDLRRVLFQLRDLMQAVLSHFAAPGGRRGLKSLYRFLDSDDVSINRFQQEWLRKAETIDTEEMTLLAGYQLLFEVVFDHYCQQYSK